MIINARALEVLIYLAKHDTREGYSHSSISMARALQKYIQEFTELKTIHHPAGKSNFIADAKIVYKELIEELETFRE